MGSRATSGLPNVRLDNSLDGFVCLNVALFDRFYLLTL
jgi:hypothetical protein